MLYGHTAKFFSAIFLKGDNFSGFLFASLDDVAFLRLGLLLQERICSKGSKFFPVRVDPLSWEAENKMKELLPLKVSLLTLTLVELHVGCLIRFLCSYSTNLGLIVQK